MLNCVYHKTEGKKVVGNDEYDQLLASGNWFDCPRKAQEALQKVETVETIETVEAEILVEPKPKASAKAKAKKEG